VNHDTADHGLPEAVALVVELHLGKESVKMDQRLFEDLEADSFDLLNIVVILEEEHDIAISESAAAAVRTVADLVALVASLKQS
jgi:acyl carrier protein